MCLIQKCNSSHREYIKRSTAISLIVIILLLLLLLIRIEKLWLLLHHLRLLILLLLGHELILIVHLHLLHHHHLLLHHGLLLEHLLLLDCLVSFHRLRHKFNFFLLGSVIICAEWVELLCGLIIIVSLDLNIVIVQRVQIEYVIIHLILRWHVLLISVQI